MAKRIRAGGENEPVDESEEESLPPSSKKIKQSSQKHFTKLLSLLENDNSLIAGLTYFLNTVLKYDSSHEEVETGIELIHNYLNQFPECDHVLTPLEWDKEKRTFDVLFLCFKCLEQILLCTAPNLPQSSSTPQSKHLHSVGNRLVQQILANHLKCVYHSLRSNMPLRLVGSCLRLLTAMVMQGPESAKGLQLLFNFGYKPLAVFPNKTTSIADPISGHSESVRQSLMRFSLSFLVVGDADVITAVLQYKGFLSSFFTLLPKDEAENILVFLTTVFDKVVMNPEIAKKVKSLFFNQYVLKQTTMLLLEDHQLETPASSGDGDKHLETVKKVLDIAHRMIITLCTDFQVGICYKSKDLPAGLEKTNNPVLLHYLLFLSGHLEDPVAQELVFKTMSSCPDLLLSYLKSLALTFEPQPTSEWVVAMTFLVKLFGSFSSVPEILTGGSEDQPSQTLSDVAVGITTPLPVNRTYFNLGLQHPVPLVKHCTLQLINAVLKRASSIVDCWGPVNRNLHSITSFLVEYCDGVLKCLPDIRTIVSLYQRLQRDKGGTDPSTPSVKLEYLTAEDKLKNANLAGNSVLLSLTLQVLGGYQKLSPDIFTQVNFNPAKLLPSLLSHDSDKESCDPDILVLVLQLNLNVCNGRSWNQNRSAVSTSLLLTQSSDSVVSRISHALTRKILLSGEDGTAYHSDADVDVFLSCLSRTCLAHPEEKASLIEVTSSAVVGSVSNRHQLREEVRELLEGDKSGEKMSLQQILELPNFDLADVSFKDCKKDVSRCEAASIRDCVRLNLLTCVLKEFRHDSVVLALIHDLMTHFLLISSLNECLSLVRLVLHRLPPSALKFSCSIPELYPLLDPKVCRELSDSHTVDQSELVPEWVLGLRDEDLQEEIIKRLVTACEKDNKSTVLFLLRALWAALWRLYGISQTTGECVMEEVFCAAERLCDLITRGIGMLSTLESRSVDCENAYEFDLDPKFVGEAFLNGSDFSQNAQMDGKKKKKSRKSSSTIKQSLGAEFSLKVAELIVVMLEKLKSKPFVQEIFELALCRLFAFAENVVQGDITERGQLAVKLMEKFHPLLKDESFLDWPCDVSIKKAFTSLQQKMLECEASVPPLCEETQVVDPEVMVKSLFDSDTQLPSKLFLLASGDSIPVSSDTAWIQNLASKFRKSALKWNTFLVNTLRSEFKHDSALHLLSLLLPSIYGRRKRKSHTPLSTICDMIWSHSEFFNIMCSSCDQETAKESLVELLIAVVELDVSVCKTAHMPVFLGSYSATRSKSDRGLLFLIHKYEENGINAGENSPLLWGEASLERYGLKQDVYWHSLDLVEILKLLDSQKLIRSTGNFSIDTKLTPCNPYMEMDSSTRDLTLYDECFLLPLLSYYLDPDSRVDCRQFIRHGCLGYLLVALSSLCQDMRKAAGHCLTRFRTRLEETRFKEKAQIVLLLDVIQNTLAEKSARLPTIFAVFASKACHLFLHADSPVYSVVAHYIVHKPSLNVREIPLFYMMLHSSSIQAHNERIWLLRVLVDGLKCKEDYQFYRRYKVFSQVAALAGSSIPDRKTKTVAMELLKTYNSYDSGRHKFIYNFQHC